ncbi:acyltransferase family protein [Nocardioides phosphati]|nr:acyltransferase family protein [Nocardioides phosphati]
MRTDIQGLRAIAVGMVVLYHLRHSFMPGGFAGVDVFFVISGFLITTHLVQRVPTSSGDLFAFWGRRIRRLLPASLVVLAVTLVAVRLFAPATQWTTSALDARAAALYVVNWALARQAVDYLAKENDPTAFQHFWSLSVEEQFYFFWPILIAVVALLARRAQVRQRTALVVALGAVAALSFAYSVQQTASDPSAAYFVTPTRVWELAAGGLLALWTTRAAAGTARPGGDVLRAVGSWVGLGLLAFTAAAYSGATPFPSWQAGVPVLGAVLLILTAPAAGDRATPGPLLALRPVQWLGDVSYSVYLWHWPLVVVGGYVLDREFRLADLAVILAATLVLAYLTERYVERPFRHPRAASFPRATYAAAAAAMAVVVGLATMQVSAAANADEAARNDLQQAIAQGGPCFGAAALDDDADCQAVPFDEVVPAPALAATDKSAAYREVGGKDCWSYTPTFPSRRCGFGPRPDDAERSIALVGNSHAGHWLPALQPLAREHNWHVDTFLASQCALSDVLQKFETRAHAGACRDWVDRTVEAVIDRDVDLVVMSNRVSVGALDHTFAESLPLYAAGYRTVLERFRAAGIPVLVLRDTPAPRDLVPTCIAENEDDYAACDGTRARWLPADPVTDAVAGLPDGGSPVELVDLTDHICEADVCHAVTGGVVTYFDGSHLTATFAHTLAPYLDPLLVRLLR